MSNGRVLPKYFPLAFNLFHIRDFRGLTITGRPNLFIDISLMSFAFYNNGI